jgi:RecJ-like exonuclease
MYINRRGCPVCSGTGKTREWVMVETNPDGTGTLKAEECVCGTCSGKGYTEYPVFTVEEAKVIAKHFGFNVIGDSTND